MFCHWLSRSSCFKEVFHLFKSSDLGPLEAKATHFYLNTGNHLPSNVASHSGRWILDFCFCY